MRKVYLDYNATTPIDSKVMKAILPYFSQNFGNPSGIYQLGRRAKLAVEQARKKVATLIGADPSEVIFTGGGTESNNFALKGIAYANKKKGNHIVTCSIEHFSVINVCKYLAKRGYKITCLPVDKYGLVSPDDLKKAVTKRTILISIMHANNEVGTIQPLKEIGKIARKRGIYFHTDAVQSVGKIEVKVNRLKVDLLSLSGHKTYGPKGIGALYIRKGTKITSFIQGGHQEGNLRAGTENVAGIVGLGKACELATKIKKESQRLTNLRDKLHRGIEQAIPHIKLNGHPGKRLPGSLNISFRSVDGESLVLALDLKGIAVSTGSACSSGSLDPSHVLLSMNLSSQMAQNAIRFSLGKGTTREDINYVLRTLPDLIKEFQG